MNTNLVNEIVKYIYYSSLTVVLLVYSCVGILYNVYCVVYVPLNKLDLSMIGVLSRIYRL